MLALAGTLSTSAFVFPVLKEKSWESLPSGQAATSILLLQDLAVAPLLVVMPYLVGQGVSEPGEVTLLTLKATVGFGSVLVVGSFILRRLFKLVAETRNGKLRFHHHPIISPSPTPAPPSPTPATSTHPPKRRPLWRSACW